MDDLGWKERVAAGVGNSAEVCPCDDIESGSINLDFLVGEEGLPPTLSDRDLFISCDSLGRGITIASGFAIRPDLDGDPVST